MNKDVPNSEAAETKIPYTGLRPFEPHEAELFFGRADQIEGLLARLESNRFLAVVGASGCGKSSLVRAGLLPALADGFLMGTGNDWRFVIARPGDAPFANLAQAIVTSVDGPHLLAPPKATQTLKNDTNPTELASVEKGLCTTSDLTKAAFGVVQKPENHRDELGGVGDNVSRSAADPYQLALVEYALRGSRTGLVDALAQCEIPATTSVLVLIDQFEELFRFRDLVRRDKGADTYETRNAAMAFVDLLLQTLQQTDRRVYVVITMRSDFMGDCDAFPGLPDAISNSQFLAPRMTRQQLSEAISDPLEACGYSVEPGFVNRVLNDVGSDPDQLPLMQHALLRTWQRTRECRMGTLARPVSVSDVTLQHTEETGKSAHPTELRIADYEDVGGVSGALDQHANEILLALGDETTRKRLQKVAVRLFCSLSERRDGGPLTRRPIKVALAALETGATESDVQSVAQAFQAANLLVFSPPGQPLGPETRLDISHESLLRQWSRLQAWIDTETKSALSYRRLLDAVRSGEPTLSDTHLAQAQEWLKIAQPNVHWAMRYDRAIQPADSLFDQCRVLIESSHQARLTRLAKEQAAAQREQALLREKADIEAQRAREAIEGRNAAQKLQAEASRQNANHYWRFAVNARDAKEDNPLQAAHLFLRGADALAQIVPTMKTNADTNFIQVHSLAAHAVDQLIVRSWIHDAPINGAQFSRDESRVLTWNDDNTVRLWDVTKSEPIQTFKHDKHIGGVQFSRNESRVLTWSDDSTARLWDVAMPEPIQTFKHDYQVNGALFSRDESRVLTWSNDSTARLWDVTQPEPLQIFKHGDGVRSAQFSRDESSVLTWSSDNSAQLWDVTKSKPIQTFKHDDFICGAQFSRDESRVLTWSDDTTARLWDVTSSEPAQIFKHKRGINGVQFSRDESRLLTWSQDGTARLWDVTKSEPIQVFKHSSRHVYVDGARFNHDESRVLTWGGDDMARLWDVTKSDPLQVFKSAGRGAQFNRDESRVLTWSSDKTARLWDVTTLDPTPDPIQTFDHDDPVDSAQFSRDESRVLTSSNSLQKDKGEVRLWGVTEPGLLQTFKHSRSVSGVKFSRDESRVLTWSDDKTARLWDVTKTDLTQTFKHNGKVTGARFSRDESRVLTWSNDNTARLWGVAKSEPLQIFRHDDSVNGAQFSRDELHVLTWSDDKSARLWDTTQSEPIRTFKHDEKVNGAQFNRDESRVLTWSDDNTARLWDVIQPEPIQIFKHDRSVGGAQFSQDESRVLTWSSDYITRLWDVANSVPLQVFKGGGNGAQFNRDESRVLTWGVNYAAQLWDVTQPEPLQTFKHDEDVQNAQFSRDESRVLTWSGGYTGHNGEARLWDVTKSEAIQTFKLNGIVRGVQFSGDESCVLIWGHDKTARLWDVSQSDPLKTFKTDDIVTGARFSRDKSRMLTWFWTVLFWDKNKLEPYRSLEHDGQVNGVQLSRDESRVLTWSDDTTARLWDITDPLAALTPAERILELEVRSGTTLDEQQNLRTLKFDEWQVKVKSPEYHAIETKLVARKPSRSNPMNRSLEQKPDRIQPLVPATELGSPN